MYVNGFKEDSKLNSTYLILKKAGFYIKLCEWEYEDNIKDKINNWRQNLCKPNKLFQIKI